MVDWWDLPRETHERIWYQVACLEDNWSDVSVYMTISKTCRVSPFGNQFYPLKSKILACRTL
jgi:hypothetical protein